MVRLREIPRTATFAWSPGPTQPLIATGTKAGAVDADFSNDTQLELWELKLDDAEQGVELQPVATVSVDSRYNISCSGHSLRDLTLSKIQRHCLESAQRGTPAGYNSRRPRQRCIDNMGRGEAANRCKVRTHGTKLQHQY
jgi:hypothetical protein